eukprot:3761821-Amphidinium_carterae.1
MTCHTAAQLPPVPLVSSHSNETGAAGIWCCAMLWHMRVEMEHYPWSFQKKMLLNQAASKVCHQLAHR